MEGPNLAQFLLKTSYPNASKGQNKKIFLAKNARLGSKNALFVRPYTIYSMGGVYFDKNPMYICHSD